MPGPAGYISQSKRIDGHPHRVEVPHRARGRAGRAHALEQLTKQELIKVHVAAIASFPECARNPRRGSCGNMTSAGALDGSFWGLLFGLIFFVPLLGMAVGAESVRCRDR